MVVVEGPNPFGQQLLSMAVYATDAPLLVALDEHDDLRKSVPEARIIRPSDPNLATRLHEVLAAHRAGS